MANWSDEDFSSDHPASYIPQRTADISQLPMKAEKDGNATSIGSVIRELQFNAEVALAQQLDRFLQ